VPPTVRERVEADIEQRGAEALHGELEPEVAAAIHPNDRQRIARATELQRAGLDPPPPGGGELWTARLRHPTVLVGLVIDREELEARIGARVDAMVEDGAADEVVAADRSDASRTARAAIGFEALLERDVDAMKRAQRAFARRQLTWMRKMPGVRLIDRAGRDDADVADEIVAHVDT
jgi:tRNA dimethylallyltransferase